MPGIRVGHCTVKTEENHTGVTVIVPGPDNAFAKHYTAAAYIHNGFGKSAGVVQVEELSAKWMEKVELPEADLYSDYVIYRLKENGEILSESTVIFCQPKYFAYPDPKLCCHVEGDTIVVEAKAYAHDVEILNENEDLILQDNYFDMEAGEKRIKIIEGRPEGLRVRSVYDIR